MSEEREYLGETTSDRRIRELIATMHEQEQRIRVLEAWRRECTDDGK